jgi:hypothetical protein
MCHRKNGVQLQTAHIITRGCLKLRYDPNNAFCLCAKCHMFAHDNPLIFSEFVKRTKGKATYDRLKRDSQKFEPITAEWYQKVIHTLTLDR